MTKKSHFIVFEGPDGSGQSTQAQLLQNYLISKKLSVVLTKEPTSDSEAGRRIRRILCGRENPIAPDEFQKLYIQDRGEHVDKLIVPALERGDTVLSDRYALSTVAFGGINLDMEWLAELNKDFIQPDMTFILDVAPEICIERIKNRGGNFEYFEKRQRLAKVLKNYRQLAATFSNIHLIDGTLSVERVFEQVKRCIATKIFK